MICITNHPRGADSDLSWQWLLETTPHISPVQLCTSQPGCLNNIPQSGGLSNRNVFSHSSGVWTSHNQAAIRIGKLWNSSTCRRQFFHVLTWPLLSVSAWKEKVLYLCTYMDTNCIGLGPHPYDSLNLITSLSILSLGTITLEVRSSTYEFCENTVNSVTNSCLLIVW